MSSERKKQIISKRKKFSFGFYFILFCLKNLIRSHNRIMCASLFRYPYYKTKSFILTYARDREKQKPTQLYVCVFVWSADTKIQSVSILYTCKEYKVKNNREFFSSLARSVFLMRRRSLYSSLFITVYIKNETHIK